MSRFLNTASVITTGNKRQRVSLATRTQPTVTCFNISRRQSLHAPPSAGLIFLLSFQDTHSAGNPKIFSQKPFLIIQIWTNVWTSFYFNIQCVYEFYFCFIVYLFISCKSKVSSKVRILRSLKINYFCVFRRKGNIIKIKFILRE